MDQITPFQHVLYKIDNRVAHVTLNRPEKLNALFFGPGSIREELTTALALADNDPQVGAILLSGAGRAFCAGADLTLTQPRDTAHDEAMFFKASERFLESVRHVSKPTIAAVHGLCLGAALGLIAQCDLVLAATDTKFGLIEGKMGLPGATEIVPLVGPAWAKFMIFTGEMLDASWAERIGLIMLSIAPDRLMDAALELSDRIAQAPAKSVQLNKLAINSISSAVGFEQAMTVGRAHDALTASMAKSAAAPDGRLFRDILSSEGPAGVRAILDRPSWLTTFGNTRQE